MNKLNILSHMTHKDITNLHYSTLWDPIWDLPQHYILGLEDPTSMSLLPRGTTYWNEAAYDATLDNDSVVLNNMTTLVPFLLKEAGSFSPQRSKTFFRIILSCDGSPTPIYSRKPPSASWKLIYLCSTNWHFGPGDLWRLTCLYNTHWNSAPVG